jgi:hypothetical protein
MCLLVGHHVNLHQFPIPSKKPCLVLVKSIGPAYYGLAGIPLDKTKGAAIVVFYLLKLLAHVVKDKQL